MVYTIFMTRFTISLPLSLNSWLNMLSSRNNRSKAGEIRAILEEAYTDETCHNDYHIKDDNSETCKCGQYIFVER